MPYLKPYRLFISHAWKYTDEYQRLTNMLDEAKFFRWHNYSVTELSPIETESSEYLMKKIKDKIKPVQAVIIISGMYVNYREWMQYEMATSFNYGKPIIGIEPWGSKRVPTNIRTLASVMVKWNTKSIVRAIREYAL